MFTFLCCIIRAQSFNSSVYGLSGYDDPNVIAQAPDSGFIIAGCSVTGSTGCDILIVRTAQYGDTLWTLYFGTANSDYARDVHIMPDGSSYVCGQLDVGMPGATFRFILAHISASGQIMWIKSYNPNAGAGSANKIIPCADGSGMMVIGHVDPTPQQQSEAFVMKTDTAGNIIWSKTYGTLSNNEFFASGVENADGSFLMAGHRNLNEILAASIDSSGILQWSRTYGGIAQDYCTDVMHHPGGGYLLSGTTFSFGSNTFLLHLDNNGDTIWSNAYGGVQNTEWGHSLCASHNGGIIMSGTCESFSGSPDTWLMEADSSGQLIWSRAFGSTGWEEGWCVIPTSDNGYAIASRDESPFPGAYNFWLIKTDSTGNGYTCNEYATPGLMFSAPFAVNPLAMIEQAAGANTPMTCFTSRGLNVIPYCMSTGISQLHEEIEMIVSPVPAHEEVNLQFTAEIVEATIRIFNANGMLVEETENVSGQTISIPTSSLPAGIFFVNVISRDGTVQTGKFVVVE